jgi:asparagine synthase (glutamine-hydrolysing)
MCGIVGFLSRTPSRDARAVIERMTCSLRHRGPDASGLWVDDSLGAVLGHRRLSIVDLSEAGRQPMVSSSGRYVISYNGEVYNFPELMGVLAAEGRQFRGRSDTEVLLEAIEEWGVRAAISRFVGMFAFALVDRRERVLWLVRDRLGIKPLYYGWWEGALLFGSELRALRLFPDCQPDIDTDQVRLMIANDYVPAPHSLYRGFYKLPPGTTLEVPLGNGAASRRSFSPHADDPTAALSPRAYWSAEEVARAGAREPLDVGVEQAIDELERVLSEAVRLRLVSDVPIGAFLSGGVDSSTVVALMQEHSSSPVRTFSIGFHEERYNEAKAAKAVAEHLGTDHTELYLTTAEAVALVPELPAVYDEPFADSSQLPTLALSRMTRESVTVSLSGDGGDELFCGYSRYRRAVGLWRWLKRMPPAVRSGIARALPAQPLARLGGGTERLLAPDRRFGRQSNFFGGLRKAGFALACRELSELYQLYLNRRVDLDRLMPDHPGPESAIVGHRAWSAVQDELQQLMLVDLVTYLPDDILVKVDRASMAVSLEARVPVLDHRVVELAWRLPAAVRTAGGAAPNDKAILRGVLYKRVPKELFDRPKQGFGVPIGAWLRTGLRDWAESMLDRRKLAQQGFFDVEEVHRLWREHLAGRAHEKTVIWNILMFQGWLEAAGY